MTDQPRIIAEFSDFVTMQLALNAAREHREMSFELMDEIAGTPKGYFSKNLAPGGSRRITMDSFTLAFGSVGVKALLVDDPDQLKRIQSRLKQRNKGLVRSGAVHQVHSLRKLRKIGAKGGANSRANMSKRAARKLARKAAAARWSKTAEPAAMGAR